MSIVHRRLLQVFALLAAWGVVVVGRLVQVQLVRHDDYVAKAQRQQERTLSLNPVRGSILDTRLRVLAESISAESIYADPQAIANRRAVARALAESPGPRTDGTRARSEAERRRQLRVDRAAASSRSDVRGAQAEAAGHLLHGGASPHLSAGDARRQRHRLRRRGRRRPRRRRALVRRLRQRHAGQSHAAQATRARASISSAAMVPIVLATGSTSC